MPTTRTEIAERFMLQGPLVPWQAVILVLVLSVIFAFTLTMESRRAGTKWPLFFGVLRLAVVGLVAWMLVGPAWQTTKRRITPRAISIITDTSGSMETVDLAKPGDQRWLLAASKEPKTAVAMLDGAESAAFIARSQFQGVLDVLDSAGNLERIQQRIDGSQTAIDRLLQLLALTQKQLGNRSPWQKKVQELEKNCRDDLVPIVRRLATENAVSWVGNQQKLADAFAFGSKLEAFVGQVSALADDLAETEVVGADQLQRISDLSRQLKVNQVLQAAEESWLKDVRKTTRVLQYSLADSVHRLPDKTWNNDLEEPSTNPRVPQQATDLAAAFEQMGQDMSSEKLSAVILLTDGRHNAPTDADPLKQADASLQGLPIYPVTVGNSEMPTDVAIHHVVAPTVVIEDDDIVIDAIVSTYQCEGQSGVLKLFSNKELIDQRQIDITSDRSDHRISFSTKADRLGKKTFRLEMAPLEGEISARNNSAEVQVEVTAEKIRVLLADNYPRWEFRYLLNLFERDEQIEADRVLLHPQRYGTGRLRKRAGLPSQKEDWDTYNVVILGDLPSDFLRKGEQTAVSEFVRRQGGTLIVIAGDQAMPEQFIGQPLMNLLPVEATDTSVQRDRGYGLAMTAEGRFTHAMNLTGNVNSSERLWKEISRAMPVYFPNRFLKPKASGRVLVSASAAVPTDNHPLSFLSWHDVGRGRVIYVAAPITYQLRFRYGDRYHHRFWGQLLRWAIARDLAVGSRTVKLSTQKPRVDFGEPVQVTAFLSEMDGTPLNQARSRAVAKVDGNVVATVELLPDAKVAGRYVGLFEELPPSPYQFEVVGEDVNRLMRLEGVTSPIQVNCSVEPLQSTELTDVRSNRPLLEQIAAVTGGCVIEPTAIEEVVRLSDLSPHVTEDVVAVAVWNQWSLLALITACLVGEWIIRKRIGLT